MKATRSSRAEDRSADRAGDRTAFELRGVRYRYPGGVRDALSEVTLALPGDRHTAILGPNGAGKSTLIRVMLGLRPPSSGRVRLWGREVGRWRRRELARRVGVVSQDPPPDFPISVEEFVETGRNPYLSPWKGPGEADRRAVAEALERTDLLSLAGRPLGHLSGGEVQRAKLARALAQRPELLLLDEPTAHLDLGHEMQIFGLVDGLVREEGIGVVSVTHNLSLASRFAHRAVLLDEGRVAAEGRPRDVLRPGPLERAFGWPVEVVDLGTLGVQVVPRAGGEA